MTEVLDQSQASNHTDNKTINIDEASETRDPSMRRLIRELIKADTWDSANSKLGGITPKNTFYLHVIKRGLDIVISFSALVLTIPVNSILALCTLLDVGRPILFRQERVGKNETPFIIIKFRNMKVKKDKNGNDLLGRDRVTKFGKFVRKTSLDELLNFLCILKGDMSVIGPRPLPSAYTDYMCERHRGRYLVKPGLECPFLNPSGKNVTWCEQFDNDAWYVKHASFSVDVRMFLALVKAVFDRESTAIRGTAARGSFMGYDLDGHSIDSQRVPQKYVDEAYRIVEGKKTVIHS